MPKHPFDAMLDDDGDSYTEIEHGLVESVEQDERGNDVRFNYKQPPRQIAGDDEIPDGYVKTRGGHLAEIVMNSGPSQAQYNWIVDLLHEKDLRTAGIFARHPDLSYDDGMLQLRQQAFMGNKALASTIIDALKLLPRKAGQNTTDQGRLRVKYHEVEIDGGRKRRIGYLTDQPENVSCSFKELTARGFMRIPESRFALDTSDDGRFANDVTFFHLWIGDRYGWKLFMYKSDDEIEMPVGRAVPLIRRFAEDMAGALKLWGDEYTRCGICQRKLTNDISRQYGIGPVCRAQWGL